MNRGKFWEKSYISPTGVKQSDEELRHFLTERGQRDRQDEQKKEAYRDDRLQKDPKPVKIAMTLLISDIKTAMVGKRDHPHSETQSQNATKNSENLLEKEKWNIAEASLPEGLGRESYRWGEGGCVQNPRER